MNDSEIIKALEWHANDKNRCNLCPYNSSGKCCEKLSKECLDLIKAQKASLNAVRNLMVQLAVQIKTAKVEAIKAFADSLHEKLYSIPTIYNSHFGRMVDNLVKETVGDE